MAQIEQALLIQLANSLTTSQQQRQLEKQEFPLKEFLILYTKARHLLYLNHMEGAYLLAKFLGPISRSQKSSISIPTYLSNYECQKLAEITGNNANQIWRELLDIYLSSENSNGQETIKSQL